MAYSMVGGSTFNRNDAGPVTVTIQEDAASAKLYTMIMLCTLGLSIPTLFPLSTFLSASVLFLLVLMPAILLSVYHRNIYVGDSLVIIGVMWVIACTLPIWFPSIYRDRLWGAISTVSLEEAALWVVRGWAFGSVAYWGARIASIKARGGSHTQALPRIHQLRMTIGIAGLLSSIVYIFYNGGASYSHIDGFSDTSTTSQIMHAIRQFALVYIYLYLRAKPKGHLLKYERQLFLASIAVCIAITISSASKLIPLQLVAIWLLGMTSGAGGNTGRVKMVLLIISALVAIYGVFQWVTIYRVAVVEVIESRSGDSGFVATIETQMEAVGLATSNFISPPPVAVGQDEYDASSVLDRLALISAFAMVLDLTHGEPPYEASFSTFLTPLYAVMPRNLFPDKAEFIDAGAFAQMLGWRFGGFSVTLPGSLYWIWGYNGILFGMAGLMAFVGWIQDRSDGEGLGGLYAKSVLILTVLTLMEFGSTIHPLITQLCRSTLIIFLLQIVAPLLFSKK